MQRLKGREKLQAEEREGRRDREVGTVPDLTTEMA